MTTFRRAVVSLGVATALLLPCAQAHAQTSTTGALQGLAREAGTREPLAGVLVVATSPALIGEQTAMTDDRGSYKITSLPPGKYLVTFHYAGVAVKFKNVNVGLNHTTAVYATIDLDQAGVTFEFDGDAPVLDPTESKHVYLIGRELLDNGVIPGLDLTDSLGTIPGTSNDGVGTAFSGSSSPESRMTIDGADVTGLSYGTPGTSLLNDFIEEIEVVTGGYNAEYGRSTGAVISAVTRSGSNELRGSVFTRVSPGALSAGRVITPSESSSIDAEAALEYQADFGVELGGPILRDRLWFYTGFAPRLSSTRVDRITKRQTDCRMTLPNGELSECDPERYGDGSPDEDPATGFRIFETLDRERLRATGTELPFLAKLNWAPAAEHQGQLSFIGTPSSGVNVGISGTPSATRFDYQQLTTDVAAKWTSKLDDNRTELSAVLGWHRSAVRADSIDDRMNDTPRETYRGLGLDTLAALGFESAATAAGCADGPGDPYPYIQNCPQDLGYSVGGPGSIVDQIEERFSVRLDGSRRIKNVAGSHDLKAGIDLEDNRLDHLRKISGGAVYDHFGNTISATRWVEVAPPGMTEGYDEQCGEGGLGGETRACRFLDEDRVLGRTLNWAAYLRDSWQPMPHLTLNYGMRYEEQRLRYAEDLQDTVDPFTGSVRDKNAMLLTGMWSPRAGLAYDWTKEGKSRAYAHWGRFFESIPMDINNRSFGGETNYRASYDASTQCGSPGPLGTYEGNNCTGTPAVGETLFGSGVLVAPGIGAQYMDELLFGLEYELMEDLKIGVSYQDRRIGRVLEDLSVDNADTYILANPGEWSADAERALEDRIARTGDPDEAARLTAQLEQFRRIRTFDKPRRDYRALQLVATRRFSPRVYFQASYTYSRLTGNYPGLFSSDNGQLDPNISSQFDLIELLSNRDGPLPLDRPHYVKLDGYYTFDLGRFDRLTTSTRFRALSGTPRTALGRHYLYGFDESFVLPRGALGRTEFDLGLDLRVAWKRKLVRGMVLEVSADLFNALNRQGTFKVSETYTLDPVNPIVGGDLEDLVFAKAQSTNGGETANPVTRYRNFGNPVSRYGPLSARLGARLTF